MDRRNYAGTYKGHKAYLTDVGVKCQIKEDVQAGYGDFMLRKHMRAVTGSSLIFHMI